MFYEFYRYLFWIFDPQVIDIDQLIDSTFLTVSISAKVMFELINCFPPFAVNDSLTKPLAVSYVGSLSS